MVGGCGCNENGRKSKKCSDIAPKALKIFITYFFISAVSA